MNGAIQYRLSILLKAVPSCSTWWALHPWHSKDPHPKDYNYFLTRLGEFVKFQGFSAAFVPWTMFNPVPNWCRAAELQEPPIPQTGTPLYPQFDGNARMERSICYNNPLTTARPGKTAPLKGSKIVYSSGSFQEKVLRHLQVPLKLLHEIASINGPKCKKCVCTQRRRDHIAALGH